MEWSSFDVSSQPGSLQSFIHPILEISYRVFGAQGTSSSIPEMMKSFASLP
jgi:hypothetical protein